MCDHCGFERLPWWQRRLLHSRFARLGLVKRRSARLLSWVAMASASGVAGVAAGLVPR